MAHMHVCVCILKLSSIHLNKNMNLLVKNDDVCRGVSVCNGAIVTVTVVVIGVFVFAVVVVVVGVVELVPVLFSTIKTDVVASFSFVPYNHGQFSFESFSFNTVLAKIFDELMLVNDVLGIAKVCTDAVHSIDLLI